jgi:hypothetical protein
MSFVHRLFSWHRPKTKMADPWTKCCQLGGQVRRSSLIRFFGGQEWICWWRDYSFFLFIFVDEWMTYTYSDWFEMTRYTSRGCHVKKRRASSIRRSLRSDWSKTLIVSLSKTTKYFWIILISQTEGYCSRTSLDASSNVTSDNKRRNCPYLDRVVVAE